MFKNQEIKGFKIQKGNPDKLFIKYKFENWQFLTSGKVDLKQFQKTQKTYYRRAIKKVKEKAKTWETRHQNYLKYLAKN